MNKIENFIQLNSPDGGFLQSVYWRKFQESYERKVFQVGIKENEEYISHANVIEHPLPLIGDYFYIPRGPVIKISNFQFPISKQFLNDLVGIAQKNNAGWIRIEPNSGEELKMIKENLPGGVKIKKAPVNVQPREILVLDISKNEKEILAEMKQKTRYNIRLAEKRGVHVTCNTQHATQENIEEFLRLVKITSKRDKIAAHPEDYYRKMFKVIPPEILKLYFAEYEGKLIAANLVLFFGKMATYMHGASDNIHREVMAPYLLQWQQILDAKKVGCTKYDFGGINTKHNNWEGITRFKTGFAPEAKPIEFPGCYDIVLSPLRYWLYTVLRRIRQ